MNSYYPVTLMTSVLALFLIACKGKQPAEDKDKPSEPTPLSSGVKFKVGKGLLVPPESAAYIGLELGEISEHIIFSTNHFTARFYQTSKASGVLSHEEASLLQIGQPVSVASESEKLMPGRISALPKGSGIEGFEEILMEITDGFSVPAGTFANVSVAVGKKEAVVSVPKSALLHTVEGWFVYTKSGDRLIRAEVKLGATNEAYAEIADGLYAGDVVVLKPVMKLWLAELQAIRGGADND
jgi:hypothetical protein